MNEQDKRNKFKELAEARTNKVINTLRLIGNLSNKRAYTYTEQDVKKIFAAIEEEVREAKGKFATEKNSNKRFSLGD